MKESESPFWRREEVFALLLTVLYAWLVLGTIRVHEPWRDEAQTWLINRDASLVEMGSQLNYQGHPGLWYLMIRPLARLGLPYSTMGLLHGVIAIASAFLVLRFAPFPRLTRGLLVFSFWMVWMYAIESRIYAAGLLLLFLIAWRYPERHARPWLHGALIALMFSSNLFMVPLAGALSAAFAWETWRGRRGDAGHVLALALMAAGALALAWQFDWFRAPADNLHAGSLAWASQPAEILTGILTAFFPGGQAFRAILTPVALAIVLLLFFALLTRPMGLWLAAVHLVGMCLLIWRTTAASRHAGLFILGWVFVLWVAESYEEARRWRIPRLPDFKRRSKLFLWALNAGLAFSLWQAWKMHAMDRTYDFSGTRRMAEYIIREGLAGYPIAVHRYGNLSSIAPYFPGKKFWYIGIGEWATYVRQDTRHVKAHAMTHEEALQMLSRQDIAQTPLLLLTDLPFRFPPPNIRPVFRVYETVRGSDEICFLYLWEPESR
ncbi:MAG: hypothetical protein KA248_10055 [Kiritimatiellae bacterium]|nr:hypothetical protein [Kiritimatiellia bacterium]